MIYRVFEEKGNAEKQNYDADLDWHVASGQPSF